MVQSIAVWGGLGLLGSIGFIALLSPSAFSKIATRGSRWVDTDAILKVLDRRIDIDQAVLPYSRWLGLAVLLATATFAIIYRTRL